MCESDKNILFAYFSNLLFTPSLRHFNKLPQTMHADRALIIVIIMVILNSKGNFLQSSHDQICM